MFFCAISGSPPTVPVVSKTSGTVYEKALIERYIDDNGTDPISGEALTKEDLIDVKAKPNTLPPRPANQTSIPALLTALQAEYDSIMLESLEIKKSYQAGRQELANALYREDAATRVIARLMKERDEAREALASIQKTIGFAAPAEAAAEEDVEMPAQQGILPQAVENTILETSTALSATRRKRKPAPGYINSETLKSYIQTNHIPSLHATKPPGITSLDLSSDDHTIVTGGADKIVQIFDLSTSKVTGTLKGHTKAITHVTFRDSNMVLSGSADKTVRIWGCSSSEEGETTWGSQATLTGHKGEITGLAIHPSGKYAVASSTDSTWSIYDLETFQTIHNYGGIPDTEGSFSYTSFGIHPDGVLHGGGVKGGEIRVWDVRSADSLAATLSPTIGKDITTLSFSENGYYLAAAGLGSSIVNIIDLRKQNVVSTWELPSENTISEVRWDNSAQFLSVSGTDFRVYQNKSWEEVYKFDDNSGVLTGARFGKLGGQVVLAGMDRTVRVLGAPQA